MITDPRGAALRPGSTAPILLWEAWEESLSITTMFRAHYHLPLSDPRVLDTDEETMARDLLIVAYRHERIEQARHPHLADVGNPKILDVVAKKRKDFVDKEAKRIAKFMEVTGRRPPSRAMMDEVSTPREKRRPWRMDDPGSRGSSGSGKSKTRGKGG